MARAEQARRTRAALLLAAAEEFELRGFSATTLSDISERLGLVRATVHFHFATKKQLAEALVEHLENSWQEIRSADGPEVPAEPVARLRWTIEQVAAGYLTDARLRAGLRLAIDPELTISVGRLADRWISYVADLLAPSGRAAMAPTVVATFGGLLVAAGHGEPRGDAAALVARYWDLLSLTFA